MIPALLIAFSLQYPAWQLNDLYKDRLNDAVEQFGKRGCDAVRPLIAQLKTTSAMDVSTETETGDAWKVTRTISALRYITGRDFYGKARKEKNATKNYFLTLGAPPRYQKIFGVWMSRGKVFFASPPVQAEVIAQWKKYAQTGNCKRDQQHNPSRTSMEFWYYGITK